MIRLSGVHYERVFNRSVGRISEVNLMSLIVTIRSFIGAIARSHPFYFRDGW